MNLFFFKISLVQGGCRLVCRILKPYNTLIPTLYLSVTLQYIHQLECWMVKQEGEELYTMMTFRALGGVNTSQWLYTIQATQNLLYPDL